MIGKLTNSDADKERLQDALAEVHEQLSTMQSDNTRERSRLIADVAALKKTLAEQNETSEKEIERMRLETIDALDAAHEDVEKAKQDAIASTQETAADTCGPRLIRYLLGNCSKKRAPSSVSRSTSIPPGPMRMRVPLDLRENAHFYGQPSKKLKV